MTEAIAIAFVGVLWATMAYLAFLRFIGLIEDLGRDAVSRMRAFHEYEKYVEEVGEEYEEYPAGVYHLDADTIKELDNARSEFVQIANHDVWRDLADQLAESRQNGQ